MTPRYRELIQLRFFREFSYKEIADKLQLPIGTVKTQIHRAREQLSATSPNITTTSHEPQRAYTLKDRLSIATVSATMPHAQTALSRYLRRPINNAFPQDSPQS